MVLAKFLRLNFVSIPKSAPMCGWHHFVVRAEQPDAVERWASLEAKSPLMREALIRSHRVRPKRRKRHAANVTSAIELAAVAFKAYWFLHGS